MFNRRIEWYKMEQGQHECSSDFLGRIKEEAALADIESLSYDDTLVPKAMSGITDRDLLSEIRKIEAIMFTKVQTRCTAHVREKREARATARPKANAAATSAHQTPAEDKKQEAGGKQPQRPPLSVPSALIGLCGKCGDSGHAKNECTRMWRDLKCTHCNKIGHLVTVCYVKARSEERGGKEAAAQAQARPPPYKKNEQQQEVTQNMDPLARSRRLTAIASRHLPCMPGGKARLSRLCHTHFLDSPSVPLRWRQQGQSFRADAILDTGSTITVMSSSFIPNPTRPILPYHN